MDDLRRSHRLLRPFITHQAQLRLPENRVLVPGADPLDRGRGDREAASAAGDDVFDAVFEGEVGVCECGGGGGAVLCDWGEGGWGYSGVRLGVGMSMILDDIVTARLWTVDADMDLNVTLGFFYFNLVDCVFVRFRHSISSGTIVASGSASEM